ncbi:fasciclin domain-containing protein [Pontivivens ytuae]|uniref:Fasciclin domain-containing protein n=1 Tax=Pontivivens ytuae TaxID=2789856 RepID=A0A7S9LT10_9RHOB|nr:fasciclin domain-containing protein [Pontivivens ytuae]QPH54180.1 fasciclin domain-containing protein [Pontivivens ytuae]
MPDSRTFNFTAFAESDIGEGQISTGVSFTLPPAPTIQISVTDNDNRLSGDSLLFNERAVDFRGQEATLARFGADEGNGGQIYAERAYEVFDQDGNRFILVEIEQEHGDEDYFTFVNHVPEPGAELMVGHDFNIFGRGVEYSRFGAGEPAPNIVEIAAGSEDFDLVVRALEAAGLVETVQGLTDVTVFAPTDAAFTQLAVDLGFEGDTSDEDAVFDAIVAALTELGGGDPIPLLTDVLLYHVSPGAKTAAEVDTEEAVATLLEGATFGSEGTELIDNEPNVANPNIVAPDINAANGTIQGIDRVLLPIDIPGNEPAPENIVDIAAGSDDFDLLVRALDAAGLTETVRGLDDVTVFAPTDAAFTQLAVDLGFQGDTSDEDAVFDAIVAALTELGGGDPIPLLTDVLLYHVSPGAKSAEEVDDAEAVQTLLDGATFGSEGTELVDNEPDVANPNIVVPDIPAENGTIQGIDRVLLPIDIPGNEPAEPELPTLAGIVAASGGAFDTDATDFDLLLTSVELTGLTGALNDPDAALTVFAPNDAAFVGLTNALGFEGEDEGEAFGFLVDALTLLSQGDPIGLLTDILSYHVVPAALGSEDVLAAESIPTLLDGATLGVNGASLVDADPDVADPNLIALDIPVSNGIAHVLDGVLLPVDVLQSDGSNAVDFIIGDESDERIFTGRDDDFVFGKEGDDVISLGRGDDTGLGGLGDDRMLGRRGEDTLDGGEGEDRLWGGRDDDQLTGGADADTFIFARRSGEDTITDFEAGVDMVNLERLRLDGIDEVFDALSQNGDDALLDLGSTSVRFAGVEASSLTADHFEL